MNTETRTTIFSTQIRVRIENLNYGNHLSFNSLASMIQETNVQWLKSIHRDATEIDIENNTGWVMKEIHINYLSEGFYNDEIIFDVYLNEAKKTYLVFEYKIYNLTAGKDIATAACKLAFVDKINRSIACIPQCISNIFL